MGEHAIGVLSSFKLAALTKPKQRCAFALSLQNNYPPALLLQGRILLGQSRFREAVEALQTAAKLNPLPEYQWTLAEALRAAGRENEASAVDRKLRQHGASSDPRTLALFLATRHENPETALRLARAELDSRSDVFTHDALAWSLAAAGNLTEAHSEMQRALAEGTEDGRLFFHAAVIASQAGHAADASVGCAKRANSRICFCHPNAMNFKAWRRGRQTEGVSRPKSTKNFSARTKYRAENSTPTSNQNLKNK